MKKKRKRRRRKAGKISVMGNSRVKTSPEFQLF
jgi:hypothetical protein